MLVIDSWGFDQPKTSAALAALGAIGAEGFVLVVADRDDANTWRSFNNLQHVHVLSPGELNAYDVLVSDCVVFTAEVLDSMQSPRSGDDK